jgi:hypothetical protein
MTEADLNLVEPGLGQRLPADYRRVMLAYPFPQDSAPAEYALLDDPVRVLEENLSYRTHGFFDIPWPSHWFAVGGDGAGNVYYLDLASDPSPVYLADHETGGCERVATDLDAWVHQLKVAEEEHQLEEERSRRGLLAWLRHRLRGKGSQG